MLRTRRPCSTLCRGPCKAGEGGAGGGDEEVRQGQPGAAVPGVNNGEGGMVARDVVIYVCTAVVTRAPSFHMCWGRVFLLGSPFSSHCGRHRRKVSEAKHRAPGFDMCVCVWVTFPCVMPSLYRCVPQFCFPPGQHHCRSTGRLIVFSLFGPFNKVRVCWGRGGGLRDQHGVFLLCLVPPLFAWMRCAARLHLFVPNIVACLCDLIVPH